MGAFGHFSADQRKFVITDPLSPPRAQINFLWNDTSISGLNQFGRDLGPTNGRAGDSTSGWITGTASWMFRGVVEYFCGIQPGYQGLINKPCLPTAWNQVRVQRRLRGKLYGVAIRRAGAGYDISVNGQPYDRRQLPYAK